MSHVLPTFLIVLAVLALLVLLGRYSQPVARLLAAVFAIPATVIRFLHDRFATLSEWLIGQARTLVARTEKVPEGTWVGMVVIATLIAAAALGVIFYTDLQLMLMTLPLMGFTFEGFPMPEEAATIVAMSVVALLVYWGIVFFEGVGFTRVTPIANCSRQGRYLFLGGSIVALLITLYMGFQLAAIRTHESAVSGADLHDLEFLDPFAPDAPVLPIPAPDAQAPSGTTIDPVRAIDGVNKALMLLSTATLFFGKWCLEPLIAYSLAFVLWILWLPVLIVRLCLSLVQQVFEAVTDQLVPAMLDLGHDVSRSGLDWFDTLRDPAFEQQMHDIEAGAAAQGLDMADQAIRAAAAANGQPHNEPPVTTSEAA